MNASQATNEIIRISNLFYQKGWCLATSGNFSAKLENDHILITASGRDKGSLTESDFVSIDLNSKKFGEASAEAEIHCAIYRTLPSVNSVLHVHSPFAVVMSMQEIGRLILKDYEMLKALAGITTHKHRETIKIFPNSQNMTEVAELTGRYLQKQPEARAILLKGHGLYTWGQNIAEAARHVEALEFLFECEYRRHV